MPVAGVCFRCFPGAYIRVLFNNQPNVMDGGGVSGVGVGGVGRGSVVFWCVMVCFVS